MTQLQDIEQRLIALLGEAAGLLAEQQLEMYRSLAEHGEPGVALENFCTQLFEYEVAVPEPIIAELAALGTLMGIDPAHWTRLDSRPGSS